MRRNLFAGTPVRKTNPFTGYTPDPSKASSGGGRAHNEYAHAHAHPIYLGPINGGKSKENTAKRRQRGCPPFPLVLNQVSHPKKGKKGVVCPTSGSAIHIVKPSRWDPLAGLPTWSQDDPKPRRVFCHESKEPKRNRSLCRFKEPCPHPPLLLFAGQRKRNQQFE